MPIEGGFSRAVRGTDAGVAVAKILGLEPEQVSRIEIVYDAQEVVRAEVSLMVRSDQVAMLADEYRKWRWVPGRQEFTASDDGDAA